MSSASGRYQSKLFNFLQRQTRHFGEGFGRTFRRLQVQTNWSLEALVYPVYLLMQKSQELIGKQLPSRSQATADDANSDTPIVQVLQIAQKLQAETVKVNQLAPLRTQEEVKTNKQNIIPSRTPSPFDYRSGFPHLSSTIAQVSPIPPIVGIASQLSDQGLVLVSGENEILDILTPYQQVILEEKIIGEIAKYWQVWRKINVKNSVSFPQRLKGVLGLSRPSIKPVSNEVAFTEIYNNSIQERSLSRIDAIVAKWETSAIVPVTRTTGEMIRVVRTQIQIFLYGTQDSELIVSSGDLSAQKPKFSALIQAALNYFFGDRHHHKLDSSVSSTQLKGKPFPWAISSVSTSSLPDDSTAWLSPDDLFANSQPGEPFPHKLPTPSTQTPPPTKRGLRFWRWQPDDRLSVTQNQSAVVTEDKSEITHQQPTSSEMEAQPDWIETSARTIGYETHPLEKVLLWLDNTMLRIEAIFAKLFHALQIRIRK